MTERTQRNPGAHFLLVAASAVVVVAGLKLGQAVLLPFALALFLAVMSLPLMFWLQKKGAPAPLAILGTVGVMAGVFAVLILLATQSATEFSAQYQTYQSNLERLYNTQVDGLQGWINDNPFVDIELRELSIEQVIDPGRFFSVLGVTAGALAGRIAGFLSSSFIVFLILVFMLAEATVFPFKISAIAGRRRNRTRRTDGRRMNKVIREVQEYLVIKTVVSLATGLLIGVFAWVMQLDFPVLLGIIGFLLNYIPTVGSIIAAVPAVLLSFVIHGTLLHALGVAGGYLVVNTVFGNFIEPSLMGRRLGLSTLVVILSLLFWAWLWGPVGALLSVPLTMVVKIALENTEDLRWVAVLLDKSPPQAHDGPSTVPISTPPKPPASEAGGPADDTPTGSAPEVA